MSIEAQRHFKTCLLVALAALACIALSPAAAQTWPERVLISVNGAFQSTTNDASDRFEFEKNLETGSTDVDYSVQGGFVFDARRQLPLLEEPCSGRVRLILHAR